VKIAIALPTMDLMHVDCAISVMKLLPGPHSFTVINVRSCYIDAARNSLVKTAQKEKCDYILMIDSDMAFPPDTFLKLMAEGKDIIGCNYSKRRSPYGSTTTLFDGKAVDPYEVGVKQAMSVATGMLLIKMSVFDTMKFPWFDCIWNPNGIQFGEDVRFCAKAFKAGFSVFCHHDLSKEIGHIGQYVYTLYDREEVPTNASQEKSS
jgi:hypothetical protein